MTKNEQLYLERSRERFFNQVKQDNKGCWIYQGFCTSKGYGHFHYKGHTYLAHRWAARYIAGRTIKNLCVCHHCDNPACVNPIHLFVGTQSDNMRDMDQKGRRVLPPKSAAGGVPVHTPLGNFGSIEKAAAALNVSTGLIHYRIRRLPNSYWRI